MPVNLYVVLTIRFPKQNISRSVFQNALDDGSGKLTLENLVARYEVR